MPSPLDFVFQKNGFSVADLAGELTIDEQTWATRFADNPHKALYRLGHSEYEPWFSASLDFLYLISSTFFKQLIKTPDIEQLRAGVTLEFEPDGLERLLWHIPYAVGADHITVRWIKACYAKLFTLYCQEINEWDGSVESYFAGKNRHFHTAGQLTFHLAEKKQSVSPFAFLATYAVADSQGNVEHLLLRNALTKYQDNPKEILRIVSALERVGQSSTLIAGYIETGALFHPVMMSAEEAYLFLSGIPLYEDLGIVCRTPAWWKRRDRTPKVSFEMSLVRSASQTGEAPFGLNTLLNVKPELTIGGLAITEDEILQLLNEREGLVILKNTWIEVNHDQLREMLAICARMTDQNVSIADALRGDYGLEDTPEDLCVEPDNSGWIEELQLSARSLSDIAKPNLPASFKASLRPYQELGYAWLNHMASMGFGVCLADDMGLGKTVQVLALLENMRQDNSQHKVLLVIPTSLISNWQHEIRRFTPEMPFTVLHRSTSGFGDASFVDLPFLSITTYGMLARQPAFLEIEWDLVILDEAQTIKNPGAIQTKSIKKLKRKRSLAMTGTPVENKLFDIWSIFDFLNPGLLGSLKTFAGSSMRNEPHSVRRITGPFILRRLKTDKSIITDLPQKNEITQFVSLSKEQRVLYRQVIEELQTACESDDGHSMQARVLVTINACKQICNHPDMYLGRSKFQPTHSGKFLLLKEICETIYEKQERVIIFTQYRQMTAPLADFLKTIFHSEGLVFHGGLSTRKRAQVIDTFQGDDYVPFIVMSIKAGGVGLNLTQANHVVLFDRWWNPAVESQAIDRVFRIGQTRDVMVHKMVSEATIEEKILEVLDQKRELAGSTVGAGNEPVVASLSIEELMAVIRTEIV